MSNQVSSTRKGLRNQFKALLGIRKPTAAEVQRPVAANGMAYDHDSPEGQLRQLADLAFLLQVCDWGVASRLRLGLGYGV